MEDFSKFTFIELWDVLEQDFHCNFREINYILEKMELLQHVDSFDANRCLRGLLLQHGLIVEDENGGLDWTRKGMALYYLLERLVSKSK